MTMTKKELKKAAEQNILEGNTKQETFEALKGMSKLSSEELATIVRSIATPRARDQYRGLNVLLILLLTISFLFKVQTGIASMMQGGVSELPILLISTTISLLLILGVAKFHVGIYRLIAILAILSIFTLVKNILTNPSNPLLIIDVLMIGGIIGLGFYLNAKLFPSYSIVKELYQNSQGQNRLKHVILFND
jgi:hypothetical protein